MSGTRQLAAIAMVAVMVLASGCAGWGTDGPDDEADADDAGDDLEEADGEAEADEGDDDPDGGDSNDTDGAAVDENEAENGTDGDEEGSDGDETDAGTTGGDQDEQTEDSGSSDSDSEQDQDGEKDTDENEESDQDEEQDSQDETHTLRVGLIDATAAGPIAGTVTVDGETKEATPDEPAEFELEDGTYTVSGEYEEGWHVQSEEIEIDGEDVETNLHTVPVRTLTVETGEPDVDVTVERDDGETLSGTTGEDGTVTFETIPGSHTIDADGYERTQFTVPADYDPDPVVLEPTDDDGDETHTLTVTIIDRTAAGPMDGTATVNGETKDVVGDEGAEFDVDDGTYTVTGEASTDGWHVGSEEVTIDGGDEEVSLPANPIRTVTVDTGEAGIDVTLADEDGDEVETKTTGDDGRVEFSALPGNYSLHADGYESTDVTVPGAHDPETVTMRPEGPGTATGTVVVLDQNDEPVEGEPVILTPPGVVEDDQKETRYTDENGEVVIELAAGEPDDAVRYGVEVRDQEETLEIMSDEHHGVQEVEFHVGSDGSDDDPATGLISVVDENGEPVADEPVTLVWEDGSEDEYTTDENGEIVIELAGLLPDDVTPVEAHVRDRSETMLIQDDEHHGVQEIEFTVADDTTVDAEALAVDSVKHRGFQPFTIYDQVTLRNTDEDDPLDVGGWQIDVSDQHEPYVIDEGTEIAPESSVTIDLDDETKMLDSAGGVLSVHDADGNVVVSDMNYLGSPSAPYMLPEGENRTCDTFGSHEAAQTLWFENAPLDRSEFDADNDGAACEARAEGDSPAAYAIVIVEDQDGDRVEDATVEIGDDTVETNAFGVASVAYEDDDFDDPDERKTLDVTVLDQETRMTVEPGEDNDPLEEGSNIEVVSVEPAVADDGGATAATA